MLQTMKWLIKQMMAAEMETLQETVAQMLKESLERALNLIKKHMAKNGNFHWYIKEQAAIHTNTFSTVFNKIDNIQVSLRQEAAYRKCYRTGSWRSGPHATYQWIVLGEMTIQIVGTIEKCLSCYFSSIVFIAIEKEGQESESKCKLSKRP